MAGGLIVMQARALFLATFGASRRVVLRVVSVCVIAMMLAVWTVPIALADDEPASSDSAATSDASAAPADTAPAEAAPAETAPAEAAPAEPAPAPAEPAPAPVDATPAPAPDATAAEPAPAPAEPAPVLADATPTASVDATPAPPADMVPAAPAPTPADAVPAEPAAPAAPAEPDVTERGVEGSLTIDVGKVTVGETVGVSPHTTPADPDGYQSNAKSTVQTAVEVGLGAKAEGSGMTDGAEGNASIGLVSNRTNSYYADNRAEAIAEQPGLPFNPADMPEPDATTGELGIKAAGGLDVGADGAQVGVVVNGQATVAKKDETVIDPITGMETVATTFSVAQANGGRVDAGIPLAQASYENKSTAQAAVTVAPDSEAKATVKASTEQAFGIHVDPSAMLNPFDTQTRSADGMKIEVQVSAPVSIDAITSGRIVTQASIEAKQSQITTGEASVSVAARDVAGIAAEVKVTDKQETVERSWTGSPADLVQQVTQTFSGQPAAPAPASQPQPGGGAGGNVQ